VQDFWPDAASGSKGGLPVPGLRDGAKGKVSF